MCSVDVITSSKARVAFLQHCLCDIRYLEAMYSFQISARHIAGVHNRRSRWGMSPDNPRLFHEPTFGYNLCEYHVPPDMFNFTHQWLIANDHVLIYSTCASPLDNLDHEARHLQHQAFAAGTSRNLHTQIRTYVLFCLLDTGLLNTCRFLTPF